MAVVFIFVLLAGYFIQYGIGRYKDALEEKSNFLNLENKKIERIVYIPQMGFYGVKLLFVPSPLIAFFNAGPVPENMTGFIDSSERMIIYNSLRGQNAFSGFTSLFVNFAGFVLLFGSLLALVYGYTGSKDHQWLKFLEGLTGSRKKLFFYLLTGRAILLLAVCLVLAAVSMLLFLINGVGLNPGKVLIYILAVFLMLLCFLFIGLGAGALKSQVTGGVMMGAGWLLLAFLLPVLLCHWTYSRAAGIESPFKVDTEKQKLFMGYEKGSNEKAGKFDASKRGTEYEKLMFLEFWNNGFKKSMEYDEKMLEQVKEQGTFFQTLDGFCPSTFFLSVSNEISGGGFINLVSFQKYTQKMKKDFIWFYADLYILSKKSFKPFIQGTENIFEGKSRLPHNFSFGLAVLVIWLAGLLFLIWLAFNRLLDRLPDIGETEAETKDFKQDEFKKNRVTSVVTFNSALLVHFLERLRKHENRHIFAPGPDSLPGDVRVKNLFSFFGLPVPERLQPMADRYVGSLKKDYKALAVLEIIRTFEETEFFIFNDFLAGLSEQFAEYFAGVLDTLKKSRKIVYFTDSMPKIGDDIIRRANERQPF
ncbi:MAG: hypothetical protein GY765_42400 [bacterium]|nr:hypothetical protein [bacterium]